MNNLMELGLRLMYKNNTMAQSLTAQAYLPIGNLMGFDVFSLVYLITTSGVKMGYESITLNYEPLTEEGEQFIELNREESLGMNLHVWLARKGSSEPRIADIELFHFEYKTMSENAMVDRLFYETKPLDNHFTYTNYTTVPLLITHCTVCGTYDNATKTHTKCYGKDFDTETQTSTCSSIEDESGFVGTVLMPGETISFRNLSKATDFINVYIVSNPLSTVTTSIKTQRTIHKTIDKDVDSKRAIASNLEIVPKLLRRIVAKKEKNIDLCRNVGILYENVATWLDTKLTILNTIKSRGPLTRRTSINHSTTIPNITRPVVWIYKENDGYPIDLDTSRTLHKSTTSKIETLRRVEHDFYYTTTFSTNRSTSITAIASILSDRQVIKDSSSIFDFKRQLAKKHKLFSKTSRKLSAYANDSISTTRRTSNTSSLNIKSNRQVIDYGHSNLKTIRRVIKDNCICCNALTNRRVVTDTQTAFNSNRKVITSNIDSFTLDTNRLIAVNYMSGYAFTKRHISSNIASDIDLYRFTTHKVSPELDILRKSTVFDWFRNPTVRTITKEADISYLTNRKTTRYTFVAQDTSRSSYHKIKPVLETKREIIKSIEEEIDTKRRVAAEISNEVDVTKKIAAKYIYLNKGQRLIVKSIDKDIDSYRETRKAFVNTVDTSRIVESEDIVDTLCIDFELKHGCLYETERCFYEANQ